MRASLRLWVNEFLSRPYLGAAFRLFLAPLLFASWAYGRLQVLRRWAYRRGVLSSYRAPVPVISVGNISAGGTGKTPCVEAVCSILLAEGIRPAVLSRGYGGRSRRAWTAVSDGARVLADPEAAGDEPVLLARRLPGVAVVVGRDRRVTARVAVSRYGAQALVLDDGFQHLRLQRDLDLITLDARRPYGNGHCFPLGLLREPPRALRDSGLVVFTRTRGVDPKRLASTRRQVAERAGAVPILLSSHAPVALVEATTAQSRPVHHLEGMKVLAFAGIGHPESFFQDLRSLGARVLESVRYPDHHPYREADLLQLQEWARLMNAEALVTTEKDAVRLQTLLPAEIPLWVLQVRLEVEDPEVFRNRILEVARAGASTRRAFGGEP